jgi:hypothetical protein
VQVLGERELLRSEVLAELSKAADAEGGPKFLHIVVKLADIESVYFNTSTGRELHAGQDAARPKSALTAALADSPKKSQDVGNRCARLPDLSAVNLTSGQNFFACYHLLEG